jgi:hypothetical protein
MIVGDEGLTRISITEDHLLQDYRIFIKRSETPEQGANAANQLLFTLLQAGLIDATIFSNLFNRASPDLVAKELRNYSKDKLMAQQKSDQAANQGMIQGRAQQQDAMNQMAQAQQGQVEQEVAMKDLAHQQEMEKVKLKEASKTERDIIKNELKQ